MIGSSEVTTDETETGNDGAATETGGSGEDQGHLITGPPAASMAKWTPIQRVATTGLGNVRIDTPVRAEETKVGANGTETEETGLTEEADSGTRKTDRPVESEIYSTTEGQAVAEVEEAEVVLIVVIATSLPPNNAARRAHLHHQKRRSLHQT